MTDKRKSTTQITRKTQKGPSLWTGLYLLLAALTVSPAYTQATDTQDIWRHVQSGDSIVILRHALAPGTGDPDNFEVDRCDTQRNLSTDGIQQAKRIGKLLKDRGIDSASVYSSQWCRCIDTANALELGRPEEMPALNSFYSNPQAGPAQIEQLKHWLSNVKPPAPLVLVTHQVVITALTGVYPSSGEAVIFNLGENNTVDVIHRVKTK